MQKSHKESLFQWLLSAYYILYILYILYSDGKTPLHYAAKTNAVDVAALLIDKGVKMNAVKVMIYCTESSCLRTVFITFYNKVEVCIYHRDNEELS